MMELQILLATYNSSRFLREQLESILAQDCRDFEVLIRDGGSTDDTLGIIGEYQRKYPETIRFLEQKQATALENFSVLLSASTAPLIMFSDHDDVWKPDKISSTLAKYREMEKAFGTETPILVFTDSEVVNEKLDPISPSMIRSQHLDPFHLTLNRLILQNVPSGNTMLVNRALVDLALPIPRSAVMHDHWLTLAAAAMGKIGFLNEATLLYRQHGSNVYGASCYSLPAFLLKLRQGRDRLRKRFMQNIVQAVEFGELYGDRLPEHDHEMLDALRRFPSLGFWGRRSLLLHYGIRKSGILRNLGTFLFV